MNSNFRNFINESRIILLRRFYGTTKRGRKRERHVIEINLNNYGSEVSYTLNLYYIIVLTWKVKLIAQKFLLGMLQQSIEFTKRPISSTIHNPLKVVSSPANPEQHSKNTDQLDINFQAGLLCKYTTVEEGSWS